MKKRTFLLATAVALFTASSFAAQDQTDLTAVAVEVARELNMPVNNVPNATTKIKQPESGEGFFPKISVTKGNPYWDVLNEWCDKLLKRPPVLFSPSEAGKPVFTTTGSPSNPNYGTRTEAQTANNLYWLMTYKESKYYLNAELFRNLLRRVLTYANEYNLHASRYQDALNDFFAVGPALYVMRMTVETYGDYLLSSERNAIDDCFRKAGDFWIKVYEENKDKGLYPMGRYCNRDLGVGNILLNTGLYLNNPKMLDAARFLIHAQAKNLYPDGGFAYIGSQNESAGYHGADITMLTRYYVVTCDEQAKKLLIDSQNCALISNERGGLADMWTTASWKHMWNNSNYSTDESVAYLSQNPYLRTFLDEAVTSMDKRLPSPKDIAFYSRQTTPKLLPSNYTVRDRNIQGVRARYGNYASAYTLRNLASNEPGHATLIGAMTFDEQNNSKYQTNAIVMYARPKVLAKAGRLKEYTWGILTDSLQSDQVVGRDYSGFGASYRLATFGSSTKGVVFPWIGRQMVFTLKDRIFCILEISSNGTSLSAKQLAAEIRLGYGGFVNQAKKEIEKIDDKNYRYGTLSLRIVDTNFPNLEVIKNKVRANGADATDVTFSTQLQEELYPATTAYFVAFELYPEFSQTPVSKVKMKPGEIALSSGKLNYELRYNATKNQCELKTNDRSTAWNNFDEMLQK